MLKQFIIFKLEGEQFGASVDQIMSITDFESLSKIPNSPSYIEGLLNLRGDVIPIVNLKKMFGLEIKKNASRIIISNSPRMLTGFLVDDASQSMTKDESEINSVPVVIKENNNDYISSVVIHEERLILIIDLFKVIEESDMKKVEQLIKKD